MVTRWDEQVDEPKCDSLGEASKEGGNREEEQAWQNYDEGVPYLE